MLNVIVISMIIAASAIHEPIETTRDAEEVSTIQWRSGSTTFDLMNEGHIQQVLAASRASGAHCVLIFRAVPSEHTRRRLYQLGMNLLKPLGGRAYFAHLEKHADIDALIELTLLAGAHTISRDWKVDPRLSPHSPLVAPAVNVIFHEDVPLRSIGANIVAKHRGTIWSKTSSINGISATFPDLAAIAELAAEDGVQWVEPLLPALRGGMDTVRARVLAGASLHCINYGPPPCGITHCTHGHGVNVMVYDTGWVDTVHQDLQQSQVTNQDQSGFDLSDPHHSTHVAGIIAGNGVGSHAAGGDCYQWTGIAPAARLLCYGSRTNGLWIPGDFYSDPSDIQADFSDALNHRADLANSSLWSAPSFIPPSQGGPQCSWMGQYGATSVLLDSIVVGALGSVLPITWIAGNDRGAGTCGVAYGTIGPPGNAKNLLVVGAVYSTNDTITSYSNWGPTADGRIKPDVVAPGSQSPGIGISSCANTLFAPCTTPVLGCYLSAEGTSQAAPVACGVAAILLSEVRFSYPGPVAIGWPRQEWVGIGWPGSTMKALLIHTAVDVVGGPFGTPVGPDYQSGYGSIRVAPALELIGRGGVKEGLVDQGGVVTYHVEVAPGEAFRATLVWDDVPGTPNVTPTLVNDLDLVVTDPSGLRHFPWTLDPAQPGAPAVQTRADHKNNVEQVFVAAPSTASGLWRVQVTGASIPQGPQSFSLCADPDILGTDPLTYCTGKTTSRGCIPFMTSTGTASLSGTAPFQLAGIDHVPGESGVLFYGLKNTALNFHGGTICVKPPFVRTPAKGAKLAACMGCGSSSCGVLRRNFNSNIQSGVDPTLTAGQVVFAQWRQRDPTDPLGYADNLSNGIRFVIAP